MTTYQAPPSGRLVVHRPRGGWRDLLRAYVVEVDGVERGKVRRGERLELEVPAGDRRVRARIDWTGSPELPVRVPAGGAVEVEVTPGGNAFQVHHVATEQSYLALREVR
ncbi:hypothetical protein [Georgenia thermotolerans]|uniref:Uncharacterized protein n=1 Tax=Georgenia thermotolerans TaxID=527326 RepID=A0A7J5UMK9_9MICO|nr:hypothetical protein [Georgenia thermotolerans]KAE8763606.1 hypothetical protein GB883_13295 [Georgenia thermotolerans]